MKKNILIVEDELPAARQLQRLLREAIPDASVLEILDSVEGAVNWFRIFPPPDLAFMDIQIADGLSLDIFAKVKVTCPVIFTTAFDQYAVQAFKVNAIDYLLKPIDPIELKNALARLEVRRADPVASIEGLLRQLKQPEYRDRFLVKTGQSMSYIQVKDIGFFRSSEGLTQAFLFSGKKYFVDHSLDELERLLNPKFFFRAGRPVILSIDAIRRIHPHLNGRLKIEVAPESPESIFVSRERAGAFKNWLGA
ncbi:MAG: LytR/AlgR family response regulator transcription factor [Saprospiraceae bacterium]